MKKFKKILMCAAVFMLVFAFSIPAFAANSDTKTWSSSVCRTQFTTSAYIEKGDYPLYGTYWDVFHVTTTKVTQTLGKPHVLYVTPKCTDGTVMGARTLMSVESKLIWSTNDSIDKERVKLLIQNPYSSAGTNLESAGKWFGEAYAGPEFVR